QVHISGGGHQLIGGGAGGVLHQLKGILGQAGGRQALLQGGHNGSGGAVGLLAPPEHAGGARLQGQGGGVAGDVGAALIDDGDDPHGDGGLLHHDAAGALHPVEDGARRVGELHHLSDALGHAGDPVRDRKSTRLNSSHV